MSETALHRLAARVGLARDWIDLTPLDAGLDAIRSQQRAHNLLAERLREQDSEGASLLQRVDRLVQERTSALNNLDRQVSQIRHQISTLQSSRVTYPAYVEEALLAIRKQCPQADPRVLCDHLEVLDPDWQMAIEGYIGGSRYAIARYGDSYCERITGFNCGYGGGGPFAVSKLIAAYLGLNALVDDPDLYAADRGFIENREYQNAAILVELCCGKAYITVYKLD